MLRRIVNSVKSKLAPNRAAATKQQQPISQPAKAAEPAPAMADPPAAQPAAAAPQQKVIAPVRAASGPTLQVVLQNNTNSGQVFAYFTGQAIDNNFQVYLLQSDGQTPYFPSSPSSTGAALSANCAISLGAP